MSAAARIALVVSSSLGYCRNVLRGVYLYAWPAKQWLFTQYSPETITVEALRELQPDGVIAHISHPRVWEAVSVCQCPVVNTSAILPDLDVPRVGVDDAAVGKLAAEHLLERGLRHFAFSGWTLSGYSTWRREGFQRALGRYNVACTVHEADEPGAMVRRANLEGLQAWLADLPRPIGIFAHNDHRALQIGAFCHELGLRMPEEVALLGADDDDLICMNAYPHLSSIRFPARQIGYEAARLLDGMMAGDPRPEAPVLFPPASVVTRASTNLMAVEDADVAVALRFIHDHAADPIRVQDMLLEVPLCRRVLERRFRALLGRSPLEEIQRVHLERAKQLLRDTQLTVTEVALASGFSSAQYLSRVFRATMGETPTEYRYRHSDGQPDSWERLEH